MLLQRVISAVIGAGLLLFLIKIGGLVLLGAITVVSIIGFNEFVRLSKKLGYNIDNNIGYITIFLLALQTLSSNNNLLLYFVFISVLGALYYLYRYPNINLADLAVGYFGSFYIGWSLLHIYNIRNLPNGFWIVIFIFIIIWATDTGAYFTGLNFGKHKLAPNISPKKTIEGFIGGIIISTIISYIYSKYVLQLYGFEVVGLIITVSVLGQFGDLFESSLKRQAGIKDSGNIIPGHGGILDRFDSTFLTAPLAYYVLQTFMLS